MPVDKFGRTDGGGTVANGASAQVQRVVSGGVTLSQVTDSFLQRDGGNAATGDINLDYHKLVNVGDPINNQDAVNKIYVDTMGVSKVSRRGGTIQGDLRLSIAADDRRELGCSDLTGNTEFILNLGNAGNKLKCRPNNPISLETTNGLLCKQNGQDVIKIGRLPDDYRLEVYHDIFMSDHFIADVHDPNSDQDAANKRYVDTLLDNKVSKSGDTITGNLLLTLGSDNLRSIGCSDLSGNKSFHIYLGDEGNQIKCRLDNPILMQTNNGVLFRQRGENVMKIGKSATDHRIEIFKDMILNGNSIVNLKDPENALDAATKNYVDNAVLSAPRKNLVGYIPLLENNTSVTGFVVSSSTAASTNTLAYKAFNHILKGSWISASDKNTGWIQVKCPERVRIFRVALKARFGAGKSITGWNLSASNNGTTFVTLFTSSSSAILDGTATYPSTFDINTSESYQYFRLNITASSGSTDVGLQYMQLYVYDI